MTHLPVISIRFPAPLIYFRELKAIEILVSRFQSLAFDDFLKTSRVYVHSINF